MNAIDAAEGSVGQPQRQYTVDDVVKLVSFSFQAVAHKVNMVEVKTADESSSFSDCGFYFLHAFCTNK
jgi:hypothetical protein